ncbi:MAG: septum formation protein Maf [Candidatus Eremiobacteraeota bacterium]|nr:septum formation protein Maf [Candidatus Eremiobacteraeota bacterium]
MRDLTSIVLASASPRRYELLTSLGLNVRVLPSDVDEGDRPGYGPRELAAFHAAAKADAVALREPAELIVAADTVVDLDGIALGKPRDADDAVRTLGALSGREHVVHTAYVARDGAEGDRIEATVSTRVRFAKLSDEIVRTYIATGDPFDKAGSYGIQGRGAALVERIEGDFYTVMGFPLGDFVRRIPELGYRLPGARAPGTERRS